MSLLLLPAQTTLQPWTWQVWPRISPWRRPVCLQDQLSGHRRPELMLHSLAGHLASLARGSASLLCSPCPPQVTHSPGAGATGADSVGQSAAARPTRSRGLLRRIYENSPHATSGFSPIIQVLGQCPPCRGQPSRAHLCSFTTRHEAQLGRSPFAIPALSWAAICPGGPGMSITPQRQGSEDLAGTQGLGGPSRPPAPAHLAEKQVWLPGLLQGG